MLNISVAIPAHNEEVSIYRTLKSLIKSQVNNIPIDITICLSACTDNTQKQINKFKTDNPSAEIKIISNKKVGKARALKMLDKQISNKIIIFIDADCSPKEDAIYKLYKQLLNSSEEIKIFSGNTIDSRYMDKKLKPQNLIEAINRVFWQHSPRKVVNGSLFSARKGVVQILPDDITLDDVYLSIYYWKSFIKDNSAIQISGSPQKIFDVINYQKNIQAGKKQIKEYLSKIVPNFENIKSKHYSQFDILLRNKAKYYPNISYIYLFLVKFVLGIGTIWGNLAKPSWSHTKSSKEIVS